MDEDLLARCQRAELEAAKSRSALHAIQNPLETISNLSFLACHSIEHADKATNYLKALDEQVQKIAADLRQILGSRSKP